MAYTVAITNQKGGVGKTTTAVNLAAALAIAERRTLLVDADPQGNTTSGVGISKLELQVSLYDVLVDEHPTHDVILPVPGLRHLSLLPATQDLVGAELQLVERPFRESALRRVLEPLEGDYEYIVVDCPPSLGLLTLNVLAAVQQLIIPIQCEYYGLEGISQLLNTVRLAEAPSFGKPILLYDVQSVGAKSYLAVAQELLRRVEGTEVTIEPAQVAAAAAHAAAAHATTASGTESAEAAAPLPQEEQAAEPDATSESEQEVVPATNASSPASDHASPVEPASQDVETAISYAEPSPAEAEPPAASVAAVPDDAAAEATAPIAATSESFPAAEQLQPDIESPQESTEASTEHADAAGATAPVVGPDGSPSNESADDESSRHTHHASEPRPEVTT